MEIARTPRNAFRCSLVCFVKEVELLIGYEGFTAYQVQTNSEYFNVKDRSEGMGAKVHVREGKNPDHQLRSRNIRSDFPQTARMLAWKQPFI